MISQNRSRNMELVILRGQTVYRPIDVGRPSFPTRTERRNKLRCHGGRSEGETVSAIIRLTVGTLRWASYGGGVESVQAA